MNRTLDEIVNNFPKNLDNLAYVSRETQDEWQKHGGCMEHIPNTQHFEWCIEELRNECEAMLQDLQEIQRLAEDLAACADGDEATVANAAD